MRRATRIPLHRQPPVWLISCVVLASLSPVMLRAFGVELGPQLPMQPVATARAGELEPVQPVVDLEARSPIVASVDRAPMGSMPVVAEPEILIYDDSAADADDEPSEVEEASDGTGAPESASEAEIARREPSAEVSPREEKAVAVRPAGLAEAKAACRRGNKDAARSVYRDLPVGDARRKEIRRACRQEGVWIL